MFSPSGDEFIGMTKDNAVHVWSLDPTQPPRVSIKSWEDVDWLQECAYSPDGSQIAVASDDWTVRFFDAEDPTHVTVLEMESHCRDIRYSKDGRQLYVGTDTGLYSYSLTRGSGTQSLTLPVEVRTFKVSPNGKLLAVRVNYVVEIYSMDNFSKPLLTLTGHSNWVRFLEFSRDSKHLCTYAWDHTLRIWDLEQPKNVLRLEGHGEIVWTMQYTADDKHLLTTSSDGYIRLWDLQDCKNLRVVRVEDLNLLRPKAEKGGPASDARRSSVVSGDSRASNTKGGSQRMPPVEAVLAPNQAFFVAFAVGSPRFTAFHFEGTTSEYQANHGWEDVGTLAKAETTHVRRVESPVLSCTDAAQGILVAEFSPDSKTLAVFLVGGAVQLFNVADPRQPAILLRTLILTLQANDEDTLLRLQFSADGSYLLVASEDSSAILDLTHNGAALMLKGTFATFVPHSSALVVRSALKEIEVILLEKIHKELQLLYTILGYGSVDEIEAFFEDSVLHPQTRFIVAGQVQDAFFMLTERFQNDAEGLETVLTRLLEEVPLLNLTFDDTQHATLNSAMMLAIERGMKEAANVLVRHAAKYLTDKLVTSRNNEIFWHAYSLPMALILPDAIKRFPDVAFEILNQFIADVNEEENERGHRSRIQVDLPSIEAKLDDVNFYEFGVVSKSVGQVKARAKALDKASQARKTLLSADGTPVKHKAVMLPDVVNLSFWNENDPFEAMAEGDMVEIFNLPATRSILAYRWRCVRKYFFFQLLLYLGFVGCVTAFTSFQAFDDVTRSLSDLYSDSKSNQAYLAFGFIALLLNTWFLFCEIVELSAGVRAYFTDIWNLFDGSTHILIYISAILHGTRSEAEFIVTTLAILLVWFKLLSYFRGFRGSGVFIRIVFKIAFEIRYFIVLWLVVLMGFANGFLMMFRGQQDSLLNLGVSFVFMFKGATGGMDAVIRDSASSDPFPFDGHSELYNLQLVLFVLFTLAANVLLLNLLIALMGDIFDRINAVANPQYRLEKAKLLISLERLFLRFPFQRTRKRWLHISAPVHGDMWEVAVGTGEYIAGIEQRVSSKMAQEQLDKVKEMQEQHSKQLSSQAHLIDELKQLLLERLPGSTARDERSFGFSMRK
eukprot:m.21404 g.21404  ORF g.21404 m.21404 type:complete len:1119 (+) comp32788_c0_seq1:123-3479(+)